MKWKNIRQKSPKSFRRLTGVKKEVFKTMVLELKRLSPGSAHKVKGKKRGPKPKLKKEDELLMMLMYYREYRTFFHIAEDYGISEPQCWRLVTQTERLLLKSKKFHLPGKKKLLENNNWEVVVVDVAEHSVERPKKNKGAIIQARKNGIPSRAR